MGYVVSADRVESPAELVGELALCGNRGEISPDQAVGLGNVSCQQLTTCPPRGDLSAAAQQGLSLGLTVQRHHDAFTRWPGRRDPLVVAVTLQSLVHAVGQPQQCQLPQCWQVARTEVVG